MRKTNKLRKLICLGLSILMLLSCAGCSTPGAEGAGKPADAVYDTSSFDAFLDDLFADEVTCDLITLNYSVAHPENFGITEYEVTYGSTDLTELDDDSATVDLLNTLKSFKYNKLTEDEKLTYDILKDYLETSLEFSDFYLYDKTLGPTTGFNCQLPVILAEFSFRTKQDVYDYVELLGQTKEYFEYILALEKMKSEKGLFMEDELADQIIEQCENFVENPDENYLIEIFNDKVNAMPEFTDSEREALMADNEKAVKESVIPAYELLAEGLESLKGTGKYAGGLCNYPDGKKYYEGLVYTATGSRRTIEEMEELLDKYMTVGFKNMGTAMRNNPAALDMIETEKFEPTEPYDILEDLQERIKAEFPELPETDYTIKYVHPSLEDNLSPAFYLTPAIDDTSENSIYINNSEEYEGQDIYTTLAHEGFPGHLYQMVYTNSKGIEPVRALLNYSGFTEGWATYVELLSYEMGAIDKDLGMLLGANQLVTLAVYAKVDIGVNYHGWTVEDVGNLVSSYFGDLEQEVYEEMYYAMVSDPANYLSYVIGGMEFMELRETAEETLGADFDPVAFHDFILTTGPAPFAIIADRMEAWMATQGSAKAAKAE